MNETLSDQIQLLKFVFKSREDVFAIRWEKGNKNGYKPCYSYDPYMYRFHKMKGGTFQNYTDVNVASLAKQENSLLSRYRKIIALRNSESVLQYGEYEQLDFSNDCISFTRTYEGDSIKCVFNFGQSQKNVALQSNEKILLGKTPVTSNGYLIYRK
ncbi:MAG: hypothetical protein IPO98_15470 [Saprospiraceae bacterium]|nr:hypothetical protein [Saprospiraceae bacterium]